MTRRTPWDEPDIAAAEGCRRCEGEGVTTTVDPDTGHEYGIFCPDCQYEED